MKRLLGLAIASLLLSPSAALAEWVNVSAATNGNQYDIESNSVTSSGTLMKYQKRIRLSKPASSGAVLVGLEEIMDCSSGAYQDLAMVVLSAEGRVISNDEPGFNAPIEQTKVGSVQHGVYNYVCPGQSVISRLEEEMLRAYIEQARANQQFYWENSREYERSMMETVRSMRWW